MDMYVCEAMTSITIEAIYLNVNGIQTDYQDDSSVGTDCDSMPFIFKIQVTIEID